MSLEVEIQKQLGTFRLEVSFRTGRETLALLGASGCGKSVTLKCIAGILTPDTGRICLDGVSLFDSAAGINLPPQRRNVGYLFQQYALFPHMTVRQNIAVAVREKVRRREAVPDLLRRFQLEEVADLRPGQLSGGQQQRCALARILASEPRAILLDEPFSALDSYLKLQLETELTGALESFPGPVLWVSHDLGEVYRSCRQVCVMDQGRSQPVQTLEGLLRCPGTEAAARLSGCENFVDLQWVDGVLSIPQWGLTLRGPSGGHGERRRAGIRARCVRLADSDGVNTFSCRVERVVEDVSAVMLLLRPEMALPSAPPLRMELDKAAWRARNTPARLTVLIDPRDILLLE